MWIWHWDTPTDRWLLVAGNDDHGSRTFPGRKPADCEWCVTSAGGLCRYLKQLEDCTITPLLAGQA